ncbi:Nucleoporin NDC1 [Chytridiales sp. JEL 0842]|nr:Nucleoporin NDC1 [Chytridiales sp. JEL 0842]
MDFRQRNPFEQTPLTNMGPTSFQFQQPSHPSHLPYGAHQQQYQQNKQFQQHPKQQQQKFEGFRAGSDHLVDRPPISTTMLNQDLPPSTSAMLRPSKVSSTTTTPKKTSINQIPPSYQNSKARRIATLRSNLFLLAASTVLLLSMSFSGLSSLFSISFVFTLAYLTIVLWGNLLLLTELKVSSMTVTRTVHRNIWRRILHYINFDSLAHLAAFTSTSLTIAFVRMALLIPASIRKYGPLQLKDTFVFYLTSHITASVFYAFFFRHLERTQLSFPSIQQKWTTRFSTLLPILGRESLRLAGLIIPIHFVNHIIFGNLYYRTFTFLLGPFISLVPFPIVRSGIFTLNTALNGYLGAVFTVLALECADALFQCIFTERIAWSPSDDRLRDLLDALPSKSHQYENYLAYLDIHTISKTHEKARKELFNELSELSPSGWKQVSGECLSTVAQLKERLDLLQRAKSVSKKMKATTQPILPPLNEKLSPKKMEVKDTNVFSPKKKQSTILEYLLPPEDQQPDSKRATTASLKPLGGTAPSAEPTKSSAILRHRASAFLKDTSTTKVPPAPKEQTRTRPLSTAEQIQGLVQDCITKAKNSKWLFGGDVDVVLLTHEAFFDIQRTIWAAQSLSGLVVKASKEDPYGLVQKDVPLILETLLGCLCAVEKHVSHPPSHFKGRRKEVGQVLLGECYTMINVLKGCVYEITTSLHAHLGRYKFDSEYVDKLERFVEFQE